MEEINKDDFYKILKIKKKAEKTIKKYGLINDNDQILIGLSGGKDSLALIEILGERMKIFRPKFTLLAAHISIKNIPYESDIDYLKEQCDVFNIPFVHHTTFFENQNTNDKSPCFLCSWYRRKALFELAKKHHCNKLALGHHLDDVLETLLMNLTFQGTLGTMPPLLKMDKFDLQIIRPLAMNTEAELLEMEKIRKYKKQKKNCPHEKVSHRSDMKKLLCELEKMNPHVRSAIWSAMEHVQPQYLPKQKQKE
jgi:tRNA(Ile)-lysidine synthase TilS/MesJ